MYVSLSVLGSLPSFKRRPPGAFSVLFFRWEMLEKKRRMRGEAAKLTSMSLLVTFSYFRLYYRLSHSLFLLLLLPLPLLLLLLLLLGVSLA